MPSSRPIGLEVACFLEFRHFIRLSTSENLVNLLLLVPASESRDVVPFLESGLNDFRRLHANRSELKALPEDRSGLAQEPRLSPHLRDGPSRAPRSL